MSYLVKEIFVREIYPQPCGMTFKKEPSSRIMDAYFLFSLGSAVSFTVL